jgi:hypothetical protein
LRLRFPAFDPAIRYHPAVESLVDRRFVLALRFQLVLQRALQFDRRSSLQLESQIGLRLCRLWCNAQTNRLGVSWAGEGPDPCP